MVITIDWWSSSSGLNDMGNKKPEANCLMYHTYPAQRWLQLASHFVIPLPAVTSSYHFPHHIKTVLNPKMKTLLSVQFEGLIICLKKTVFQKNSLNIWICEGEYIPCMYNIFKKKLGGWGFYYCGSLVTSEKLGIMYGCFLTSSYNKIWTTVNLCSYIC